ncbi:hypothetical protein N7445_004721 [Penicillium cf. griseofulvum]|nr:hypothetical protein N7445_004721 [Penicillium cf. griseofulvum]
MATTPHKALRIPRVMKGKVALSDPPIPSLIPGWGGYTQQHTVAAAGQVYSLTIGHSGKHRP